MDARQLEQVEEALLVVSEARERAERAARTLRRDGDGRLVEALERADRELLALHGDVMRAAYFPARSAEQQLRLAG